MSPKPSADFSQINFICFGAAAVIRSSPSAAEAVGIGCLNRSGKPLRHPKAQDGRTRFSATLTRHRENALLGSSLLVPVGVLRLRRAIRFAHGSAALRMTILVG